MTVLFEQKRNNIFCFTKKKGFTESLIRKKEVGMFSASQ